MSRISVLQAGRWCFVLVMLIIPAIARAQATPLTRPTTAIEPTSCLSDQCHSSVKATPVVHGPVAGGNCDSCHELTSAQKHTFRITREKADLCTFCHDFSLAQMPVIHKPVAQGECLGCHNPHGGATKGLLREASVKAMCDSCHEDVSHKAFVHAPVKEGACDSCHPPHASMFPKLLDAAGSDLCLACHKEFEPAMATAKSVHPAMKEGCERCHDPHASDSPMMLHEEMRSLCLDCHKDIQTKMASAKVPHSAVSSDRACMNCHAPHASNVGQLLSENPLGSCLRCHDKQVTTADGRKIASVKDLADPKLVKHGEIRDGLCGGCHEVHGAQLASLLRKPYTMDFYQQFSPESQALCFECHDIRLAQAEKTDSLTSFRNGKDNLHFVHANRGDRDKNCAACHATHVSPNERMVRNTVAFGKWNMPMRFAKTQTGGSCQPGCHREYTYDRQQPVAYATTAPAQKHPQISAVKQELQQLKWSAQAVGGKKVDVPNVQSKPTALVVVRGADPSLERMLPQLRQTISSVADVTPALVVSGPDAKAKAEAIAQSLDWPVVADPDNQAMSALGVRGIPVVLVLRGDGMELARVSGESEFLAIKLMPYLELAAGKIDQKTASQQAATGPVNEVDPARRLSRDVRTARSLVEEGRPSEALVILGRTPAASDSPEAQLLRAEALLGLNRSVEAVVVLDHLAPGADQTQMRYLRALAMFQQERWSMAGQLLEEVLKANPKHAAAHRLMAKLFERDQNWEKAAEHYRLGDEAQRAK